MTNRARGPRRAFVQPLFKATLCANVNSPHKRSGARLHHKGYGWHLYSVWHQSKQRWCKWEISVGQQMCVFVGLSSASWVHGRYSWAYPSKVNGAGKLTIPPTHLVPPNLRSRAPDPGSVSQVRGRFPQCALRRRRKSGFFKASLDSIQFISFYSGHGPERAPEEC